MFRSLSIKEFLFCLLAININLVLSVLIVIPFSKHQMWTEFKAFWRLVSKEQYYIKLYRLHRGQPILVSSAMKAVDH